MRTLETQDNPFRPPTVPNATANRSRMKSVLGLWRPALGAAFVGVLCAGVTVMGDFVPFSPGWWTPVYGLLVMTGVSAVSAATIGRLGLLLLTMAGVTGFQILAWGFYLVALSLMTGGELRRSDIEFVFPYIGGSWGASVVMGGVIAIVCGYRKKESRAEHASAS